MVSDSSFPLGLPESERARWNAMTQAQRKKAAARISAFEGWRTGTLGIDDAVKASDLSRSRFYRLAAEWRAAPSLSALGALTGSGAAVTRLDPDAVNALQAVVSKVVRLNAGASVSQLIRLMVEQANVPEDKLPGAVRLRQIVDNELRRVAATGDAGYAVQFDCSAINLPAPDRRPYILFACIDTGTRLIMGSAVAEEANADEGYRVAAADAQRRIAGPLAKLPWALRLTRIELTAGIDIEKSVEMVWQLRDAGVQANVQLSRVDKRFGKYFRQVVGERIGRVAITPRRTTSGIAAPDNGDFSPWTLADAAAAVTTAVDEHNSGILRELDANARGGPPEDLILAFETLVRNDVETPL
jgi:citrate lyase gamma subunit